MAMIGKVRRMHFRHPDQLSDKDCRRFLRPPRLWQPRPATGPAVAAAPAASAAPVADAAKAFVAAWASAGSERRVDNYLAFCGKEFTPERGASRNDWEKSRRQKIASRKTIAVAVRDLAAGDQRLTVRFVQDYSADGFSEKGTAKTLLLAREGKDWRIVGESRGSAK